MSTQLKQPRIGGIDSHKDTIHVAVITPVGADVADHQFPTTQAGYAEAAGWLASHGPIQQIGVEGTSSYGRGITTVLQRASYQVIEVSRTRPAERRRAGKTDRLDAYRAARSVLSQEATVPAKHATIEPLRAVMTARRSATKAIQATWQQIQAILVNAAPRLRDKYRNLDQTPLLTALHAARPNQYANPEDTITIHALRQLARRHRSLSTEITEHDHLLQRLTTQLNPALTWIPGVGGVHAATFLIAAGDNPNRLRSSSSFAALCGTAPVPVASGKSHRHRIAHGGDRQANAALHAIIKTRLSCCPRTRDYYQRLTTQGATSKSIFRRLKRYLAREIFRALTGTAALPAYHDLKPARQAANLSQATIANHLNVTTQLISRLENGKTRNDDLTHRYRQYLQAA